MTYIIVPYTRSEHPQYVADGTAAALLDSTSLTVEEVSFVSLFDNKFSLRELVPVDDWLLTSVFDASSSLCLWA